MDRPGGVNRATSAPREAPSRAREGLFLARLKEIPGTLLGTVAAVPALQEAAEGSWLALGLRRTARQAIAEIQSRLVTAAPGQLSLAGADAETGRLSLATADARQLTLATDTAGQLAVLPHGAETEKAPEDVPSRSKRKLGAP